MKSPSLQTRRACPDCRVPYEPDDVAREGAIYISCAACARSRNINSKINSIHWIASGTFVLVAGIALALVLTAYR